MTKDADAMTPRDEFSVEAITRGLKTHLVGVRVSVFDRVASTNDVARQLAEAGEPDGTLVLAEEQTAGRGRLGRSWVTPAGSSLLMSLVLRPTLEPSKIAQITMAISLAACDGIRSTTSLEAQIKWPNDILLRNHKCGGILAEASITGEKVEYVVVGLGLNVNFAAASIEGIPADATSLSDEIGEKVSRAALARAILQATDGYYLRMRAGEDLHTEWMRRLVTLHQHVRAQTASGTEEGLAEDFDPEGTLLLRRADGTLVHLLAEDVTLSTQSP